MVISRQDARAQGLKFYGPTTRCKNGHLAERYVENYECRECVPAKTARYRARESEEERVERLAKSKVYRDATKDEQRVRMQKWRAENVDRVRQQRREWLEANKARAVEYNKAFYAERREEELARCKAYQSAHKKEMAANARAWKQANPEAVRAIKNNRRAREKGAEGKFTRADIERLLKLQKGRCAEPGCRISLKAGYHIDHKLPLTLGGSNDWHNLQLLCQPCNNGKYNKDPIVWAREKGRLV